MIPITRVFRNLRAFFPRESETLAGAQRLTKQVFDMRTTVATAVLGIVVVACGGSSSPSDSGQPSTTSTGGATPTPGTGGTVGAGGAIGAGGVASNGGARLDGGPDGMTLGSGGTVSGTSGKDCVWLADCVSADTCTTKQCVDACGTQASGPAVDQYLALVSCIAANPQCTTTDCLHGVCANEISACSGPSATVDGGVGPQPIDAGVPVADAGQSKDQADAVTITAPDAGGAEARPDAALADTRDALVLPPPLDAPIDGSIATGNGYTTSGSCDIVFKIPGILDSHTCWDYTLTVTANHNDGFEHYVAYTQTDVSGTQSACTSQSYSASQPGPWDSASLSASNLSHKKQACDLSGSSGATATWTEGGTCSLAGSLGHCSDTATNQWDPSTQILSSSLNGVWSVP